MEPTCLEAAAAVETTTAEVTAATKLTATAAVSRRPCHGTQRHGCDTDY
jgi:hypothetical protein